MTDLTDLIERVRAATGPDRRLDADIMRAICRADINDWWYETPWGTLESDPTCPPITESVDAALALAERVLPGWAWKIGTCSVSDDAWLVPAFNCPIHGERLKEQLGYPNNVAPGSIFDAGIDVDRRPSGQPALAMCEATLLAVQATGAK